MMSIAPSLAIVLPMRPREKPSAAWQATLLTHGAADGEDLGNHRRGVLLVTNKRLAFLQERGTISHSLRLEESMDLNSLTLLQVEGGRSKGLRVRSIRRELLFSNLCEIDPVTLRAIKPASPAEIQVLLDDLRSSAQC